MSALTRGDRMIRLGLITVALFLLFALVAFVRGVTSGAPSGERMVSAVFDNAQQLRTGDEVRLHGVPVGVVKSITLNESDPSTTVRMSLSDDAGPVFADATVDLHFRLALGGSFVIDLHPGTPQAGELANRTIASGRTTGQIEVEDVTSIDRGAAERGLQKLPGELGEALHDPKAPARAFEKLAEVAPDVTHGVGALRGSTLDSDLRRMVSATGRTMDILDSPGHELQGLTSGAAATLATIGGRSADVQQTLALAPGVLDQTDSTLARLDDTLDLADGLIDRVRPAADDVKPTAVQLRPTLVDASEVLDDAEPLVDSLRPAVSSLGSMSRKALPLFHELLPTLRRIDKQILPFMSEVDPATQHSMTEMVGPTFAGVGGASAQTDNNGHFIRFPATSGNSPFYLPCQIYAANPDKDKLIECNSLEKAFEDFLSYNPLGPTKGVKP